MAKWKRIGDTLRFQRYDSDDLPKRAYTDAVNHLPSRKLLAASKKQKGNL